jgi:3-oxoacyl-[acyl-carrier protein] reductase
MVTGGSRGIGLAIAGALAAEGARTAIVARDPASLEAAAASIGALPVSADLTSPDGCKLAFDAVCRHLGPVEILINNLGGRSGSSWSDTGVAELEQAMAANVYPATRLSRLALPAMRQAGWGRVVIVASIYGRESGGSPAYNLAKAAELSWVTSLGREVAESGVTVNAVAPGSILWPGGSWDRRRESDPSAIEDFVRRELPRGSFGTASEVASVVTFLVSEQASLVTGACWTVDGGQSRSNL